MWTRRPARAARHVALRRPGPQPAWLPVPPVAALDTIGPDTLRIGAARRRARHLSPWHQQPYRCTAYNRRQLRSQCSRESTAHPRRIGAMTDTVAEAAEAGGSDTAALTDGIHLVVD